MLISEHLLIELKPQNIDLLGKYRYHSLLLPSHVQPCDVSCAASWNSA